MNEFSKVIRSTLAKLNEVPGSPFEIIPKGRGRVDAAVYKFFRWYNRRYKREISSEVERGLKTFLLKGSF